MRDRLIELPIDDAILILKEEHKHRVDGYTTHLSYGGKGDPAEEVSLDALEMAISALEQTKWISVKDRLPEENVRVLGFLHTVFEGGGHWDCILVMELRYGLFIPFNCSPIRDDSVTHWMPLPQPPKDGRKGGAE